MINFTSLINNLNKDIKLKFEETESNCNKQWEKYQEIDEKLTQNKEINRDSMESIMRSCSQLTANKHAIKKSVDQTEGIEGWPISSDSHENAVNLIGQSIKFLNTFKNGNSRDAIFPDELQKEAILVSEQLIKNYEESTIKVAQTKTLVHNTKQLKMKHEQFSCD